MKHISYISIGSNLGDRINNCIIAIAKLSAFSKVLRQSSFYETESWGYYDVNLYINAVLKIETELSPEDLLNQLQLIEKQMGRIHAKLNDVYESRIIDLDILFFDTVLLKTHQLTIPHIHLYDRNYVLIPFHEIEPNFKCPVKKDTICNLLKLCQDKSKVNLYPH